MKRREFVVMAEEFPHGLRCSWCEREIPMGHKAVAVPISAVAPHEGPGNGADGLQDTWAWVTEVVCHPCAYPDVWAEHNRV